MSAIPSDGSRLSAFAPETSRLSANIPIRAPAPGRLMHAVHSALAQPGHDEQIVAGRIVLTPDGRPIRSIITGRRHQVTGSYASRKAGQGLVFESMNEHDFYQECEVDPRVIDYRAQPFRFEFVLEGQVRRYIPDCVRLLECGSVEVVEIKGCSRQLQEPDYAAKLERAKEVCGLLGWRFSVVLAEQIRSPAVRRRNVLLIQQDRLAAFDERHVYLARKAIDEAGGEALFGEAAAAIEGPPRGEAILRALMVVRVVEIELERPLCAESRVRLHHPRGRRDA
ncbi:TnsA endonuclease N-terminal domain-containing protein [Brevundimonas sp. ZS04]|uniref:TnsA endonuclease N-terminal domain-containing protein n=1 Tax=Brevundimonas sp. ZS04 TaxID=1906854 RepID=UPI0009F8F336|nr:TnsA endonuclease N-terminal domain-containing protein [Brevundimonas sp. ZS04]